MASFVKALPYLGNRPVCGHVHALRLSPSRNNRLSQSACPAELAGIPYAKQLTRKSRSPMLTVHFALRPLKSAVALKDKVYQVLREAIKSMGIVRAYACEPCPDYHGVGPDESFHHRSHAHHRSP